MTHAIERYRWCIRIDTCYLNSTMWLLSLSYDSHHLLDSLWHAFDQWCILCMLSNYDDVVGGRSDRLSASLSESLQLVATWCKMATMIVMMMAMGVMLVMVAIMLAMLIVAPSFVDSFCHWLVHNCIVKHVHVLHAWYRHYCRVIAIAGLWHHWLRLAQDGSRRAWSQFMYISVKLTCTCLLLPSCLCN